MLGITAWVRKGIDGQDVQRANHCRVHSGQASGLDRTGTDRVVASGCGPRKIPTPAIRPAPTVDAECTDEGGTMMLAVVFDNNPFDPRLRTAWGFAAWLAYVDRTVLFDTGSDGRLPLSNMAALGLDPQTIGIVVLSHTTPAASATCRPSTLTSMSTCPRGSRPGSKTGSGPVAGLWWR